MILEKYREEFDEIEGSFHPKVIDFVFLIDEVQKFNGIKGHIAEIGVHRGKSFVPMLAMCNEDENGLAIDCFELQQYNYDNSGYGNYKIFMEVLETYILDKKHKVKVIKGDSTALSEENILDALNGEKIRMFSVDGCHTADATYIDMKNAYNSLTPGGVIILDDYFNQSWPGVSEGASRFLAEEPKLKPFCIGWNKVFYTHPEWLDNYKKIFEERYPNIEVKSKLNDSEVIIYSS